MKKLPLKLRVFMCCVYVVAVFSLYFFIKTNYISIRLANFPEIVFFVLLAVLTETFTATFRNMAFSTTFAVTIAVYILFGPLTAILVALLGYSFRILKVESGYKHILNTPLYGTFFNYCAYGLPILFANYVYIKLGGDFYISNPNLNINGIIVQLLAFTGMSFFVNWIIISLMFSIFFSKNIIYSLLSNFKLIILNSMAMLPFAIILALLFIQYKYLGVLLFIFPIVLSRYTFSLYIDAKSQYMQTVDSLMRAIEARDKYTEGHSQRVAQIVGEIAKELKYDDWKIDKLNMASMLHDVGKIGIDDHILNKPGQLTAEEFDIIKKHPEIGYNILKDVKNLQHISTIVKYHHERYDGKGYPEGKKADELDLDTFIVQLADCIDAMATDRPYRKALTNEQIIEELRNNSGTQFHPKVVEAYLRILEKKNKTQQEVG